MKTGQKCSGETDVMMQLLLDFAHEIVNQFEDGTELSAAEIEALRAADLAIKNCLTEAQSLESRVELTRMLIRKITGVYADHFFLG